MRACPRRSRAVVTPAARERLGEMMQENSPWSERGTARLFVPFSFSIPANAIDEQTADVTPQNPDSWVVSIASQEDVAIRVYVGSSASGRYITLYGGGSARLPADGGKICFQNMTAIVTYLNVAALRNCDDAAISSGTITTP